MPRMTFTAGKLEIETTYNPLLVEALKTIPSRYRNYDETRRVWTVYTPYDTAAADMCRTYFPGIDEIGFPQEPGKGKTFNWEEFNKQPPPGQGSAHNRNTANERNFVRWEYSLGGQYTSRFRHAVYDDGTMGPDERNPDYQKNPHAQGSAMRDADYATLHITETAPKQVAAAAFKALALLNHPDKPGGSTKAMQDLNNAWERLRKKRGW